MFPLNLSSETHEIFLIDYENESNSFNSLLAVNTDPKPLDWFLSEHKELNLQRNMYLLQLSQTLAASQHDTDLGRLSTMKFSSKSSFNKFIGLFHLYSGANSLLFAYHLLKSSEPGLSAMCGLEWLLSSDDAASLGFSSSEAAVESNVTILVSEIYPESPAVIRLLSRLNLRFADQVAKVLSDSNISTQWGKSASKGLLKRVSSGISNFQPEIALEEKSASWFSSPLVAVGVATSLAAVVATFVTWKRNQSGS